MKKDIKNQAEATYSEIKPKRLVSLDAFRGLTIIGMLLVNNIALDSATPRHLAHAGWNEGITFADLVFPWFLFIVGVAIPYAAASRVKKGIPIWKYDIKVFSRAAMLVLLGCFIDSSLNKTPTFDLGVLQLIGLAYMAGALLCEFPTHARLVIAAGLLVLQWLTIRFVPVPGVGAGVFTESSNIIKHFNELYFKPYHLGGLLSVVPTSALVLIGTAVGDIFRKEKIAEVKKVMLVILGGIILLLTGWLWTFELPFNKPFWTASYILYTAGLGSIILGLFYLIIDVKRLKSWAFPLVVFGMNAIAAYVTPIIVKIYILQGWTWGGHDTFQQAVIAYCKTAAGQFWGGWIYTGCYIVFWWLVMLILYRKKIFLRV